MEFKLFKNENYDQQKEKHSAYLRACYKLVKQRREKCGIFIREYFK